MCVWGGGGGGGGEGCEKLLIFSLPILSTKEAFSWHCMYVAQLAIYLHERHAAFFICPTNRSTLVTPLPSKVRT